MQAMARAGTVAVLLPGAFYFLRETQLPPVAALRAAGVPIAIATDHNPGSSPTLSLLLMINMACTLFRLTPEEALRGVTVNGARALGLADRGTLAAGQRADFAVWDLEHPNELAYWFGRNACRQLVVRSAAERDARTHRRPTPTHAHASSPCTAARTPLLVSMPHVGTRPSRTTLQRAPRRARAATSRTPTGISSALYALRARARREPHRAALLALRHRPEPAARGRADVPGREQHRAVPDALLHRRRRSTARARRRTRPRSRSAASALLAALPPTRCAASSRGCARAHGHAVLFDGHSIKSRAAVAVRGHACPT